MTRTGKQQYWASEVRELRASGKSRSAFSRERGYSAWTLRYWERRFDGDVGNQRQSRFASVAVRETGIERSSSAPGNVRVRLPMNVEIETASLPSAEWLADILLKLRQGVAS